VLAKKGGASNLFVSGSEKGGRIRSFWARSRVSGHPPEFARGRKVRRDSGGGKKSKMYLWHTFCLGGQQAVSEYGLDSHSSEIGRERLTSPSYMFSPRGEK